MEFLCQPFRLNVCDVSCVPSVCGVRDLPFYRDGVRDDDGVRVLRASCDRPLHDGVLRGGDLSCVRDALRGVHPSCVRPCDVLLSCIRVRGGILRVSRDGRSRGPHRRSVSPSCIRRVCARRVHHGCGVPFCSVLFRRICVLSRPSRLCGVRHGIRHRGGGVSCDRHVHGSDGDGPLCRDGPSLLFRDGDVLCSPCHPFHREMSDGRSGVCGRLPCPICDRDHVWKLLFPNQLRLQLHVAV